jgi:UDP-glucuronate decarboxylase
MNAATTYRVLVAGGAGFIGSHLCRRLLDDGHAVLCVDNFFTGSIANIEVLLRNPQFELLEHDIVMPLTLPPGKRVDRIFNLACPASPIHYQLDPIQTLRTCVEGSRQLLELAWHSHARILQASTSEVYGDPKVHPQREDYWGHVNPVGIRSCYDEGKRCAETLFCDYARQHGVDIKIARIFNTYGPHMAPDDGRVVSNFIMQALSGSELTLYGDGRQTRAFCYVDDMVEALVRLMDSPLGFTGPVNLGNPQEMSMLEIAECIRRLCDCAAGMVFRQLPSDDPLQRCPDISLARAKLDWQPQTALDNGLRRTIAYFRDRVAAGGSVKRVRANSAIPVSSQA